MEISVRRAVLEGLPGLALNASERTQSVWPLRRQARWKEPPGGRSSSQMLLSTPPSASFSLTRHAQRSVALRLGLQHLPRWVPSRKPCTMSPAQLKRHGMLGPAAIKHGELRATVTAHQPGRPGTCASARECCSCTPHSMLCARRHLSSAQLLTSSPLLLLLLLPLLLLHPMAAARSQRLTATIASCTRQQQATIMLLQDCQAGDGPRVPLHEGTCMEDHVSRISMVCEGVSMPHLQPCSNMPGLRGIAGVPEPQYDGAVCAARCQSFRSSYSEA